MLERKDIELPDFDFEFDTEADESPEPAVDEAEPETDEADTPEEESDEEVEETEVDETGGDEPEETEESEEAETEGEKSADLEELPHFDRKSIEGKPELEAAYKHMQSAFTKAVQQARTTEREARMVQEEMDAFVNELRTDEGATELLLQIAINRPDVFEKAYERAISLTENEGERKLFEREQTLKQREKEIEREARRKAEQDKEERGQAIVKTIQTEAAKLGLKSAQELEIAEHYVANVILEKRARGEKNPSISASEIRGAIEKAATSVAASRKAVEQEVERRLRAEQQEVMKKKAKDAKRPAAPKASRSPGQKTKKIEIPRGVDPLDAIINARLNNQ